MTLIETKLTEALNAKNNDIKSFVWKFGKQSDGTQPEIRLVDATDEQLQSFYNHCQSMLYNEDKNNPGRYTLLDIIQEQRDNCNIELFLKRLERGELGANKYTRFAYLQDIIKFLHRNYQDYTESDLDKVYIGEITGGLPLEYARIPVSKVKAGCLNQLGVFDNKHITFNFILNLGIDLSPMERKQFNAVDSEGNKISKIMQVKKHLNIKDDVMLTIKNGGLNLAELKAMINLRKNSYSDLTTDQLTALRNKVLFRLESEVRYHIKQWKELERKIELVAQNRGLKLNS